jgi:hypothetical protein
LLNLFQNVAQAIDLDGLLKNVQKSSAFLQSATSSSTTSRCGFDVIGLLAVAGAACSGQFGIVEGVRDQKMGLFASHHQRSSIAKC